MNSAPDNASSATLLALALLGGGSCGDASGNLPPVVWGDEHYLYATDVEEPVCAATLRRQGEFAAGLADVLFGPPDPPRKFIYYVLDERSFLDAACPDGSGCYTSGRIFSREPLHLHEIVHAVNDLSIGASHPFFGEGIAEVFRDRYLGPQEIRSSLGEGLQSAAEKLPDDQYVRAGHFMAYILDTYGETTTLDLLTQTRPGQTGAQLEDILADVTGLPYEQLAADYAAYPLCNNRSYRWPITECASAPPPWSECQLEISVDVDCTVSDALGPREDEVWITRTLAIPDNGVYGFSTFGDTATQAYVELGRCTVGCKQGGSYVRFELEEEQDLALEAGQYYLSFVRGSSEPGTLGVRVLRHGPTCGP
ncbi:MAG: hypothetical protein JNL82_20095 [Myxococcales bacterium]|nr:hypothetical protein [Myxococcales bacterium]